MECGGSTPLFRSAEMPRKKLTIKRPSQLEVLQSTPSDMARDALLRSGAGPHGEHRKHNRQKDRQEEMDAKLETDDGD
jgi:hypothetical protein